MLSKFTRDEEIHTRKYLFLGGLMTLLACALGGAILNSYIGNGGVREAQLNLVQKTPEERIG